MLRRDTGPDLSMLNMLSLWGFGHSAPPPEHVWPEELSQKALAAIGWEDPRLQDGGVAEGASEGACGGSLYWFSLPKPTSWNLNCRIFLRRWANFANLCLVQTYSNKVADQQLENMMPPFWTEKPKETKNFSPRRPQSSSEPARFCGLSVDPGIFCEGLWQIQDVLRSGRTSIELQQEIVWHSGTLVSLHHPLRFGNSELSEPEGTSRGQPKFLHVPTHHSWIPMTPVDPATMSTLRYSTMRKTINRQRWAKGPWAKAVA